MNLRTIGFLVLGIVAGIVAYSSLQKSDETDSEQAVEYEFGQAPAFDLRSIDGTDISLQSLEGKVVLINFWATWCGPCRIEMPMLRDFQSAHEDEGLRIVGVSVDEGETEIVVEYADEFGFNYPVLHDKGTMARDYGAEYAVPTTVVVDRSGKVRHRIIGLVDEEVLRPIILDLLAADI